MNRSIKTLLAANGLAAAFTAPAIADTSITIADT